MSRRREREDYEVCVLVNSITAPVTWGLIGSTDVARLLIALEPYLPEVAREKAEPLIVAEIERIAVRVRDQTRRKSIEALTKLVAEHVDPPEPKNETPFGSDS